jgi:hypothetical protein
MWRIIKSSWLFVVTAATLLGIFYVPVDTIGIENAAEPWRRWLAMVDQNTALWVFSICLTLYLAWIEAARPALKWYRAGRGWIDSEEAGKLLFDYLKQHKFARDDVASNKSQSHPLPFSGAMAPYFEKGLNDGIIKARGHEENLDNYQDVPSGVRVKDGKMFGALSELKEELAAIVDGSDTILIGLIFKKRSVQEYIRHLQRDALDQDRAQALQKESRAELPPR